MPKLLDYIRFRKAATKFVRADYQPQSPTNSFTRYHVLIDAFEKGCLNFDRAISNDDQNIIRDKPYTDSQYFYGGRSALKLCIDALLRANANPPKQILDFPCGHGRAARFFRAAFPDAKIFASDLIESGCDFCAEHFGTISFRSYIDFADIQIPSGNDLIWCGSLVTHIDQKATTTIIEKLIGSLSETGILVFTTHGRAYPRNLHAIAPMMKAWEWDNIVRDYYRTGYGYQVYPTPEYLEIGYGCSLISPAWIHENIIHTRDEITLILFAEKGWHDHQDAYAIQKRPLSSWYDTNFL